MHVPSSCILGSIGLRCDLFDWCGFVAYREHAGPRCSQPYVPLVAKIAVNR